MSAMDKFLTGYLFGLAFCLIWNELLAWGRNRNHNERKPIE